MGAATPRALPSTPEPADNPLTRTGRTRSTVTPTPLLVTSSALFWGLPFAILNPVLALLLVGLYDASATDVGWVLGLYNASGFLAALVIPAWADRSRNYLRPLLLCGTLTLALAGALAVTSSLPLAVLALVVLGGPAGVGVSLLFADLKHSGATPSAVINTRAIVSIAWVGGPPLATFIMGSLGNAAILPVLAVVALLNVVTTVAMVRKRRTSAETAGAARPPQPVDVPAVPRGTVVAVVIGFVALQATNSAAISTMGLFVTERLGLPLIWSGVALGVSALVQVPALLIIGRLSRRFSAQALLVSGCAAGIAYYAAIALVADPVSLVAVQPLNSWFFGIVAGIGLTLFQDLIPRPGLASGLLTNTRRVGAILSGAIISAGSTMALGYQGVFAICTLLTLGALVLLEAVRRAGRIQRPEHDGAPADALLAQTTLNTLGIQGEQQN